MTTEDARWWDLVDRARQEAGAEEPQARAALLVDWLSRLADRRAAAEGVDADDEPFECEEMWGVASRAFAAKTGESLETYYQQLAPRVPRSEIGEPFDEDTVEERYPEVVARFSSGADR